MDGSKGKGIKLPNASKTQDAKKYKPKEKVYKGRLKLSPIEMERYQKVGKFFKCGEHGRMSCECSKKTQGNASPKDIRGGRYSYM